MAVNLRANLTVRLFLLSLLSLFTELLVIRWMSEDIRAFTIFKSFPLVTFFVGLGLGFAGVFKGFSRWFPAALLLFAIEMKQANLCHFGRLVFPSNTFDWLGNVQPGYLLLFMYYFTLLLSVPFLLALTIGSAMAPVFKALRPLVAYSINVAGALVGSILFGLCSFSLLPPWILLATSALIMLYLPETTGKKKVLNCLVLGASVLVAWSASSPEKGMDAVYWSPYQRLDIRHGKVIIDDSKNPAVNLVVLFANHAEYQSAMDLTPAHYHEWKIPDWLLCSQYRWMLPYQLRPSNEALIVAAGMGSDVAQALRLGVKSIDAVDIDPVILRLGKKKNPLKPYADPRVHIICDDARHYFWQCKKKYDLIVFSILDSHTVLGIGSSVRLDNYIYTRQSISQAMNLLKPDGLLVLSFLCSKDWFVNRLFNTIKSAAGYPPFVVRIQIRTDKDITTDYNTTFILGDSVKSGTFQLPEAVRQHCTMLKIGKSRERVLTDDWPYLYLENKPIDPTYLAVLAEIIVIVVFLSLPVCLKPSPAVNWQLFFMGGAFMLLELQLISRLALLFGATWLTTSIVINGALLMILAANALVLTQRLFFQNKTSILYATLLASLTVSYLLPTSAILHDLADNHLLACLIIGVVTFLPVFVVAIIFATAFDRVTNNSQSMAFNLLGTVMGALCEYLSNYTGINALLLIVIFLYAISYLFARRSQAMIPSIRD